MTQNAAQSGQKANSLNNAGYTKNNQSSGGAAGI